MDPFGFWDSLPIVGSYFAGMPRFVKFILTSILILVVLIGLGKMMGESKKVPTSKPPEKGPEPKPKEHHRHGRHRRQEQKQPQPTQTAEEDLFGSSTESSAESDLFGEPSNDLGLDLGGGLDLGEGPPKEGSIESLLAGQPITPESELGEMVEKPKKKQKKPGQKQAATKKKELPEASEPVGLPEELEEELEKEEPETGQKIQKRRIGKKPPVEFEEINLAKPKERKKEGKPKEENKGEKKGGGLFGLFGGGKNEGKPKKLSKIDIMKMLDEGKPDAEILKMLEESGMNHGEARRFFGDIKRKWEANRKPLLDKKKELEHQKKMIQYQYLKMQIDEETFKKMMTDIQKKLVDINSKLKFTERHFT